MDVTPPDVSGLGYHSVDDAAYVRTGRMESQRWLLDSVIKTCGVDWDQGRSRYTAYPCGIDAQPDFQRVRDRVKKFADIDAAFAEAAERRERLAWSAHEAGHKVEAREHAFVASILWGNAEWPLFGDSAVSRFYSDHKESCFDLFIEYAPHPVVRVEIPFRGSSLPGLLHLPPGADAPLPCLIHIGGMDSFKEHRVELYGDKYLARGIAQLAVEIPGQGQALERGLRVTHDSAIEAGRAIMDWVRGRDDIDLHRLGIAGNSFGSFWATQMAAVTDAIKGCAVMGVIHEPGMGTIFQAASPTFKARFMYMAGYRDEDAFDDFAAGLDLRQSAPLVASPYLVVAGEDDELSPLHHTIDLLRTIPGPVWLVVYAGERHGIGAESSSLLGPNRHHLIAGWMQERFQDHEMSDRYTYIDRGGQPHERAPIWR